jgi:hypothetical protein
MPNNYQRWIHPAQQQGRLLPWSNSVIVRSRWSIRVSGLLLEIIQQIHSFRASFVRSFQRSNADSSPSRASCKSDGTS